ncbi:MAG: hypothetical protein HYY96_17975 [Candidatus Tectomicrobia bacterium]|nr:hypothetical protein [Candidatus Tectomicrobia bacterium]
MLAALQAGAQALPFVPVRGLLESDLLRTRPDYKVVANPFDESEQIVLVPALRPEFALLHGFQADAHGNVLLPGGLDGVLAAQAAERVIVTVEELVDHDLFEHPRPGVVLPALYVESVVLAPSGARPTGCPGYYEVDGAAIQDYLRAAADPTAFAAYLARSVLRPEGEEGGREDFETAGAAGGKRVGS